MASVVPGTSTVDRAAKRLRLAEVLGRHGADSIVLRSHTAVAWALDGARTHVSLAVAGVERPIELDRAGRR